MEPSQKKKKILFLITKSNWGGAQRYVFDLATHLPADYEPVVALGGNGALSEKLTEAHIRVITLPSLERDVSLLKELKSIRELSRILREERPDIFHVNSSKAGAIGTLLGRLHRVPLIVFTAHGWAFNEERSWWQRLIIKSIHWLTVLFSHRTIAVSDAIKKQLTWPGAQKRMTVIHPGRAPIAFEERMNARQTLLVQFPNHQDVQGDIWVGTIGELHPIKQHERTIAAMATLIKTHDRLRYFIIGGGNSQTTLETLIKKHQLEQHVFLVGAITEAGRFLQAFDMFVLPSRSEAFGYVLVEAGQAKLPVIAANVGGVPEIITNNTSGLLIDPTPDAIAVAVDTLLDSPTLRGRFGEVLHQMVTEKFSLDAMVDKTVSLYSETIPRDS